MYVATTRCAPANSCFPPLPASQVEPQSLAWLQSEFAVTDERPIPREGAFLEDLPSLTFGDALSTSLLVARVRTLMMIPSRSPTLPLQRPQ